MKTKLILGLMIAAAAVLPALADLAPQPGTPAMVTAGANDTAGDVGVGVGGHVVVRLPVSGGTGYSWKLLGETGPELALAEQRTERGRGLGAPQLTVFDFEAQTAGQKELTFGFFAPGAADESAPAKTYVLTVSISE